ncbi:phospholipase D-like domain-containing protein [Blastopirellula marina]|uniref:PLD phosphodiesterase domain-containing protein n=1 Tax=Blastopirellula marina TaxID=124 RepID=A0A2S8F9U2_9BACT|nr:phospholipase D-like domain-containing protein [Blastopirellula marina]PQO28915.1 hypothetical protein C5Y98_24455 [Blastopirellula marina]PTL42188.1 hypothetical protein C5Y97_24470 [Blastopirellula marina]
MLDAVHSASKHSDVRIITNLPKRWNKYWGNEQKKSFQDQLNDYQRMLSNVPGIEAFFNVSNHMKIVMTNEIAYLGSSNFSPESGNNYECGVLISLPDVIAGIRNHIVDYLSEYSAPLDLTEIGKAKLEVQALRNRLKELTMALFEGFYETVEGSGKIRVFRRADADVSQQELESYVDWLDDVENFRSEYLDHPQLSHIAEMIDDGWTENIWNIVGSEDSAIYRLTTFSLDDSVTQHWQKYAFEGYDEKVDYYMELANDDALEELNELADEAKNELKTFGSIVTKILEQTKVILNELQKLEITKWGVDNT